MIITKDLTIQSLFIDFPNIGKIIRPVTLDFVTNDKMTVADVANENELDITQFINQLQNYIDSEEKTNYTDHTKRDIAKTVHDRYLEDLKDELPVLHVYIKKITKKYIKDENLHVIYDRLKNELENYTEFLEETLHPLINKLDNKNVAEALIPYNTTRYTKEQTIVSTFNQLREETDHYVSTHEDAEVDFIYNRLEHLERLVSEMIILEQFIAK